MNVCIRRQSQNYESKSPLTCTLWYTMCVWLWPTIDRDWTTRHATYTSMHLPACSGWTRAVMSLLLLTMPFYTFPSLRFVFLMCVCLRGCVCACACACVCVCMCVGVCVTVSFVTLPCRVLLFRHCEERENQSARHCPQRLILNLCHTVIHLCVTNFLSHQANHTLLSRNETCILGVLTVFLHRAQALSSLLSSKISNFRLVNGHDIWWHAWISTDLPNRLTSQFQGRWKRGVAPGVSSLGLLQWSIEYAFRESQQFEWFISGEFCVPSHWHA